MQTKLQEFSMLQALALYLKISFLPMVMLKATVEPLVEALQQLAVLLTKIMQMVMVVQYTMSMQKAVPSPETVLNIVVEEYTTVMQQTVLLQTTIMQVKPAEECILVML